MSFLEFNAPQFKEQTNGFTRRLKTSFQNLGPVPRSVWEEINVRMEAQIEAHFKNAIKGQSLSDFTRKWKQTMATSGTPRQVTPTAERPILQQFVNTYGKATGFWQEVLWKHIPAGGAGQYGTRQLVSAEGGPSLAMRWGIKLSAFHNGYPGFILKPQSASDLGTIGGSGERSLVHLSTAEAAQIANILWTKHVKRVLGGDR